MNLYDTLYVYVDKVQEHTFSSFRICALTHPPGFSVFTALAVSGSDDGDGYEGSHRLLNLLPPPLPSISNPTPFYFSLTHGLSCSLFALGPMSHSG